MGPLSLVCALILPAFSSLGLRGQDREPIPGFSTRAKLTVQLRSLYKSQ